MENITKAIKSLKESGWFIASVCETVVNEVNEKKVDFLAFY